MSAKFVRVDQRVGKAIASIRSVYGYKVANEVRKDAVRVMSNKEGCFEHLSIKTRELVIAYESGKLKARPTRKNPHKTAS